jgi:flagellin-like hook-associated protein FlgL
VLLTNASALTALKTLRSANASLDATQNRISSGLKVAKAQDNAAFFLVAATQRSDITALDGARENLTYALGAVRTAMAAQDSLFNIMETIASGIIALESGFAEKEIDEVIAAQIDQARQIIRGTSYNGINLLEGEQLETFNAGYRRDGGTLTFDNIFLQAQGFAIKTAGPAVPAAPLPGAVMDFNSFAMTGSEGNLNPMTPGNINGINIGTNGSGGTAQRTFAISFETGADVTTEQVIYEEGGNVRGLNISVRNGMLVFGGYNLPGGDPGTQWAYREVTSGIEANTRYTAQLVLDGNIDATGQFRAYLDGTLVDVANGVGILYDHPGGIGIGQINGNAVVNGTVVNDTPSTDFQGRIDKVVAYNQIFTTDEFDQVTTYLAEGWLPPRGVQYYVGSELRLEQATLLELLESLRPDGQAGYSTDAALKVLDAARAKANRGFAELGFAEGRIIRQREFLDNLTGSMEEGVAALVEADLQEESAKLQAFQVQTDLARQSLVISNQRPTVLLRLFN